MCEEPFYLASVGILFSWRLEGLWQEVCLLEEPRFQPWKLPFLPPQTARVASRSARTFLILPTAPAVTLVGRIPKAALGPQHPMSTYFLDSFTQIAQQHHKLRGPKLWSSVYPWFFFWLSGCKERSCQPPVPQISWSSCINTVSSDPHAVMSVFLFFLLP